MGKKLIIISTCTNAKWHLPDNSCLLDLSHKKNPLFSIKEWVKRLSNNTLKKYPASKLYKGSHWKETLQSLTIASHNGFDPELWILSAGWGLIPSDFHICSYSATFSAGKNSIHNLQWPEEYSARDRSRYWWEQLHNQRILECNWRLASLPEYFDINKCLSFLFILSKEYYFAVEPEIMSLIGKGHDVFIISAGLYSESTVASPMVKDYILPFNDKYKQLDNYLNHTNTTLNARLAVWLLSNHSDKLKKSVSSLYKYLVDIENSLPEVMRKDIGKMTDDDVLCFIDRYYDADKSSATTLLKRLRHEVDKSCEQKRFGKLFQQYKNNYCGGLFDD